MASSNLTLNLETKKRWWFSVAVFISYWLLYFNLIREAKSDQHFGGVITPLERTVAWLVKNGLIIEANPPA
jgi:hypothetical protein